MKKGIVWFSVVIALLLVIYYFSIPKEPSVTKPTIKESETVLFVEEKEKASMQATFHSKGYGFIQQIYVFDPSHYLVFTNERKEPWTPEYGGNQLVWVTKKGKEMEAQVLTTGDHMLHLVLKETKPFFITKGQFVFSYYEAIGTTDKPMKGKGYVYHIGGDGTVSKKLETDGSFYSFSLANQNDLVFIEKIEVENRNLYPSYFAPHTLLHRTWNGEAWQVVKQEEVVPDLQKAYDEYESLGE